MTREELQNQGYYSINRLSEILDVDSRTIKKKLATEAPDKIVGKSEYYQLDRVSEILDEASKQGSEKQQLECKKIIAQITNIELRNSELSKKLIPSEEVARSFLMHISKCRSELIKIIDLAPILCGLDANSIKVKLKEGVNAAIEELHNYPIDEPESKTNTK